MMNEVYRSGDFSIQRTNEEAPFLELALFFKDKTLKTSGIIANEDSYNEILAEHKSYIATMEDSRKLLRKIEASESNNNTKDVKNPKVTKEG